MGRRIGKPERSQRCCPYTTPEILCNFLPAGQDHGDILSWKGYRKPSFLTRFRSAQQDFMEEIEIKKWVTLADAALAYAGRKSA